MLTVALTKRRREQAQQKLQESWKQMLMLNTIRLVSEKESVSVVQERAPAPPAPHGSTMCPEQHALSRQDGEELIIGGRRSKEKLNQIENSLISFKSEITLF